MARRDELRAMQDAWRAYLDLAMGLSESSRKQATKTVKRLVGKGGATAEQLQGMAEDLIGTGMANRESLGRLVRFELDRTLGRVGLATVEEVNDLTQRVRDLEKQLREAQGATASGPAAATGAGKATVSRKVVAKKVVAKKSTAAQPATTRGRAATSTGPASAGASAASPAKKTVAKKAVAKKTVAKKAVAKKAVAKKAVGPSGGTTTARSTVATPPAVPARRSTGRAVRTAPVSGSTLRGSSSTKASPATPPRGSGPG